MKMMNQMQSLIKHSNWLDATQCPGHPGLKPKGSVRFSSGAAVSNTRQLRAACNSRILTARTTTATAAVTTTWLKTLLTR